MHRIQALLVSSLLLVLFCASPARASGDFECSPSWVLMHGALSDCTNMAMLSPGNDTRVNLLLLLADRDGQGAAATSLPPSPMFNWPTLGAFYALRPKRDDGDSYAEGEGSRCRSNDSGTAGFEAAVQAGEVYAKLLAQLARWRVAGNRVVGVQIDFDARTRHLDRYAGFLADLKRRLPAGCRLGITGLLDWSSNGDPKGLGALAGVVDDVVLQIYQGRRVIPGYAVYLARLGRFPIPFRIGLLEGGDWQPPPGLEAHPFFRGYVVFLRNDTAGRPG